MSDIPKFEDWSRERKILDDDQHIIPLTPLEIETSRWWGYIWALVLLAILLFVVLHK